MGYADVIKGPLQIGGAGFFALYLGIVQPAMAAPKCTVRPENPVVDTTSVLQGGNLTVGPDTPDGTIIFRQYFKATHWAYYDCEPSPTPYSYSEVDDFLVLPLPLSSWSGTPFGGRVYETGVPGIGVAAWYSGTAFPWTRVTRNVAENSYYSINFDPSFDINFIKIGPISAGTISGNMLPTIKTEFVMDDGTRYPVETVSFSGAINIVSQSCMTPDVYVELGRHDIAAFKGVGSGMPWVPFNIELQQCPTFHGTLNDGQNTFYSNDGSAGVGARSPNIIKASLMPNTTIIDDGLAIMGLADTGRQAEGIGIQIAIQQGSRLASFNQPIDFIAGMDGSPTRYLPYLARYIQTEAEVTPGDANGTMAFLIEYQ
ncbi:type 1 fimbria pilin [Aeromonas sp. BIGb0405]|uniref:fimbrial protein n=1 Tax=unclassified Aeromonas TaxID=257493 RepID=UPI00216A34F9|nr:MULTISPECIES: fimbrial protein [unclassified Aeromonas]MCS3455887.1 type 1 fimbria pilin [Aeromonas sp. BIGb0405]MCS3459007.1 type 1 fimbria pilin [Aeromonas sp. BIGb0445]